MKRHCRIYYIKQTTGHTIKVYGIPEIIGNSVIVYDSDGDVILAFSNYIFIMDTASYQSYVDNIESHHHQTDINFRKQFIKEEDY